MSRENLQVGEIGLLTKSALATLKKHPGQELAKNAKKNFFMFRLWRVKTPCSRYVLQADHGATTRVAPTNIE